MPDVELVPLSDAGEPVRSRLDLPLSVLRLQVVDLEAALEFLRDRD